MATGTLNTSHFWNPGSLDGNPALQFELTCNLVGSHTAEKPHALLYKVCVRLNESDEEQKEAILRTIKTKCGLKEPMHAIVSKWPTILSTMQRIYKLTVFGNLRLEPAELLNEGGENVWGVSLSCTTEFRFLPISAQAFSSIR